MPAAAPTFAQPGNRGSIIPSPGPVVPIEPTDTQLANRTAPSTSEPAVLSSDSVNDQITDAKTRLTGIAQKGTTVGQDGSVSYADGSAVPAPSGATYNDKTGQYEAPDGNAYSASEFYGQNGNAPDPDYVAVQNLFAPVKAQLDASTLKQVSNIQSQFEDLIAQQKQAATNAMDTRKNALISAGTTRYAPFDSSNQVMAQMSYGLQQIKNLDAQENDAIAKAQQAQSDGDYKTMTDALTMAEGIRTQKQTAATTLATSIQTANQKLSDQQIQASRDTAIADLVSQGVTDPGEILQYLNEDPNAGPMGGDFTSDEVANALKNIVTSTGSAGIKGLTGDVGNFYTLKATPGALPASILALPAEQQLAAYIKMVNQAKSTKAPAAAGTGGGTGGGSAGNATGPINLSTTEQAWVTSVLNGNATMQQVPAALRNNVAVGLTQQPQEAYSPLASSRFTTAANRITSNFIALPQYELTANGLPYLQRIDAAMKNPGSVSDQDLLDSLTKLNTAGNAISDAQVKLITDGRSLSDSIGVWANHLQNGGVLSDNQRQQIQTIAKAVYANYQKGYQPVYDQVTKQLQEAGIPKAFWTMPDLNNLSAQAYGNGSDDPASSIGSSNTIDSFLSSSPSPSSLGSSIDWSAVNF